MTAMTTNPTIACGHCRGRHADRDGVRRCAIAHNFKMAPRTGVTFDKPEPVSSPYIPKTDWFTVPGRPETRMAPAVPASQDPSAPLWKIAQEGRTGTGRRLEDARREQSGGREPGRHNLTWWQERDAQGALLPEVAHAYYAVENNDGVLRFYKVDKPTTGRYAGSTFVAVQASNDFHPVKGAASAVILAKIAEDAKAAAIRYGKEIGRCSQCNRTLTDPASIEAGIGPVCAGKAGWL